MPSLLRTHPFSCGPTAAHIEGAAGAVGATNPCEGRSSAICDRKALCGHCKDESACATVRWQRCDLRVGFLGAGGASLTPREAHTVRASWAVVGARFTSAFRFRRFSVVSVSKLFLHSWPMHPRFCLWVLAWRCPPRCTSSSSRTSVASEGSFWTISDMCVSLQQIRCHLDESSY